MPGGVCSAVTDGGRASLERSAMCYIFAMILKLVPMCVFLMAMTASAQAGNPAGTKLPAQSHSSTTGAAPVMPIPSAISKGDCQGAGCDYQPSHITVATPAPAPSPWPLQDRIAWGANVLLALLGYAGILVAISVLRKIERQTRYAETAAQAAEESARAALLHAQAIIDAERPWVLVTIVPSRSIENGFTVIATNRGRGPAEVISAVEETRIAVDETQLPVEPEYNNAEPETPFVSIILLPGEFMNIKSFCRDDVKNVCGGEEDLQRIENWEERIFLYGKVVYRDLMGPANAPVHETGWCCRYIHGRQKSGLVMAGSREYNVHS